jgi:hypothetical protein
VKKHKDGDAGAGRQPLSLCFEGEALYNNLEPARLKPGVISEGGSTE